MAACLFTILLVNPLREVSLEDDWNFALMVRHLLETGEYRLHEWLAPNLPFQTYWGGLFASAFGFSFTSLRASTLVVVAAGLVAFYVLGRDHGLNDVQSGLVTLGFLASPLFVLHSFTFNTDAPFLMYFVISLLFYTRAMIRHSYPLMLLASIAASAAILTRQFGLAIPAGVFALWLLRKEQRTQPGFFAVGLLLPAIAGAWQVAMGMLAPTKLQWREMHLLSLYFADTATLLTNTVFRPAIILQYLALFSLPFVFLALPAIGLELIHGQGAVGGSKSVRYRTLLVGALALYVVAGVIHAHVVNHTPWLMPYLIWDYFDLAHMGDWPRVMVTLVTSVGAVLYGYIFVLRYSDIRLWSGMPVGPLLLNLIALFQLAEQLLYYKDADRHLMVFLPFLFLALGHHLAAWLCRFRTAFAIACLIMLTLSSLWTRGRIEREEAGWKGAQSLLEAGVPRADIFGLYPWNCYHGLCDDYLREVGDANIESFADFWSRFYPERRQQATFVIVDTPVTQREHWTVIAEIPYRTMLWQERRMYVVKRTS